MIKIKRIYDPISKDDGKRILVDRLWPRGVKKEKAAIDEWLKDIAPSDELRNGFLMTLLNGKSSKINIKKNSRVKIN
jgi:uncharacterized protein YeaO (DUF488 family)